MDLLLLFFKIKLAGRPASRGPLMAGRHTTAITTAPQQKHTLISKTNTLFLLQFFGFWFFVVSLFPENSGNSVNTSIERILHIWRFGDSLLGCWQGGSEWREQEPTNISNPCIIIPAILVIISSRCKWGAFDFALLCLCAVCSRLLSAVQSLISLASFPECSIPSIQQDRFPFPSIIIDDL